MRGNRKRLAVLLLVSALCMSAAAPMKTTAADAQTTAEATVSVRTTQRCSIWSAPATADENRVKYVDEGYQIQIYPQVIESELGDGKTFYRTIKGAYVLCRCVAGAGTETPPVSSVGSVEPLVPVGDATYMHDEAEIWRSYTDDAGVLQETGISYGGWVPEKPVTDTYGVTYRGVGLQEMIGLVAHIAANDAEAAHFLEENGSRIMIVNGDLIYQASGGEGGYGGPGWSYGSIECQRGECVCILTADFSYWKSDLEAGESYVLELAEECFDSLMGNTYWQNVLQ